MALCRTGFSFRAAVGQIDEIVPRIKEFGWPAAPITDRCSTWGYNRWTKACKAAGLRPVYGVELAVVPDLNEKKPPADNWTFLATSSLVPLHELIDRATKAKITKFPALSYETALAALNAGLIVIAGERLLLDLDCSPRTRTGFYLGLGPHTPKSLYQYATSLNIPSLAVSENYYPTTADKEFYRVALGRNAATQTYPMHLLSDDEWCRATAWFVSPAEQSFAIANRNIVLERSLAKLEPATLLKPERPRSLDGLCRDGAMALGVDLANPVYAGRLDRELCLIDEKKFEDYFYIISDVISFAKQKMIVGPARGSSCGSLVCYLLGITTIDPIPYGLMFERFIDVNRKDLPDIDIDFSDERRHLVFDYMERKFGRERVARLGTIGMFKTKSALNQAAATLRIPRWKIDKLSEGLEDRFEGEARATKVIEDAFDNSEAGKRFLTEYPEMRIATRLEGHPNVASQHAAGMLLTEAPIRNYVAVDAQTGCAMIDKRDAESLNLLKIDALGLTQLSVFEHCLEQIGVNARSGWLEQLPLDDPAAFAVLNQRRYSGIFQFMGHALQGLLAQFTVESLDDMIATTALARPGPLENAPAWIRRRKGEEPVETVHPLLTEITKDTYGIPVYQETVMRVVREIGGLSWEDTSEIRKGISKSMGDEYLDKYKQSFVAGAAERGVDEPTAVAIWEQMRTFGKYGFNKSHAVAYSIVSYWCCWLKAYHPLEFAAATLQAEKDPERQIEMLRELHDEGIDYIPVDKELSGIRWQVATRDGKRILVGPLTSIKGIGPAALQEIMDARAGIKPLRKVIADKLENPRTPIDDIYPIRTAIGRLDLSEILVYRQASLIKDCRPDTELTKGKVVIIGIATGIKPGDENDAPWRKDNPVNGNTRMLKMWLRDDTSDIFCKIGSRKFHQQNSGEKLTIGETIIQRGERGKAIYCIEGTMPKSRRMINVTGVKYLGSLDQPLIPAQKAETNAGDQGNVS